VEIKKKIELGFCRFVEIGVEEEDEDEAEEGEERGREKWKKMKGNVEGR